MPLSKLKEFDPSYRDALNGNDIDGFSVYAEETDEKVGSVEDLLVDEDGSFRYLIVDLGFWIFGKKVILPIGRSRINFQEHRVYALGMTKKQAEDLPEFKEDMVLDYDYEERVRGTYRSPMTQPLDTAAPLDTLAPLDISYRSTEPGVSMPGTAADPTGYGTMADLTMPEAGTPVPMDTPYLSTEPGVSTPDPVTGQTSFGTMADPTYDRDTYNYQQEPDLYGLTDQNHQNLRLYEERLIANKRRQKTGEVAVGKRVETETARTSIPVERERVVIERTTPMDAGTQVTPGEATFQSGEVARMEVYEEAADVRKETFVREEINVRKEVDRDTVEAEETIRREELDIDSQGHTIEDRTGRGPDSII